MLIFTSRTKKTWLNTIKQGSLLFTFALVMSASTHAETHEEGESNAASQTSESQAPSFESTILVPEKWPGIQIGVKSSSDPNDPNLIRNRHRNAYDRIIEEILEIYACQGLGHLDKFGEKAIPFAYWHLLDLIAKTSHSGLRNNHRVHYYNLIINRIHSFINHYKSPKLSSRSLYKHPIYKSLSHSLLGPSQGKDPDAQQGAISAIRFGGYEEHIDQLQSEDYLSSSSSFKRFLDSSQQNSSIQSLLSGRKDSSTPFRIRDEEYKGLNTEEYCKALAKKNMELAGVQFDVTPSVANEDENEDRPKETDENTTPPVEPENEEEMSPDAPTENPIDTPPQIPNAAPVSPAESAKPENEAKPSTMEHSSPRNVVQSETPGMEPPAPENTNPAPAEEQENPEPGEHMLDPVGEGKVDQEPGELVEELTDPVIPSQNNMDLRDEIARTLNSHEWNNPPYQIGWASLPIEKEETKRKYNSRINRTMGCSNFSATTFHHVRQLSRITRRGNGLNLTNINDRMSVDLDRFLNKSKHDLKTEEIEKIKTALRALNKVAWEGIFEKEIDDSDKLLSSQGSQADSETIDAYFEDLLDTMDPIKLNDDQVLNAIANLNTVIEEIGKFRIPCSEEMDELSEVLDVAETKELILGPRGRAMLDALPIHIPGHQCLEAVRKGAGRGGFGDYLSNGTYSNTGKSFSRGVYYSARNSHETMFWDRNKFMDVTDWVVNMTGVENARDLSPRQLKSLPFGAIIIYGGTKKHGHIEVRDDNRKVKGEQIPANGFSSDFYKSQPINEYMSGERWVKKILFPVG